MYFCAVVLQYYAELKSFSKKYKYTIHNHYKNILFNDFIRKEYVILMRTRIHETK